MRFAWHVTCCCGHNHYFIILNVKLSALHTHVHIFQCVLLTERKFHFTCKKNESCHTNYSHVFNKQLIYYVKQSAVCHSQTCEREFSSFLFSSNQVNQQPGPRPGSSKLLLNVEKKVLNVQLKCNVSMSRRVEEVCSHYPSAFTQRAATVASPAPGQYDTELFVSFATWCRRVSVSPPALLSSFLSSSRLQARRREEDRRQEGAGGRGARTHCEGMAPPQARSASGLC